MGWSWRIGQMFGIDVRVHPTFLILLGWVGLTHVATGAGWVAVLGELGFLLLLFGIVVLHELGHALAARRYGIRTRDITLLPFGGIARLERIPEEPGKELVIALAGPAVNVALAAGLLGVLLLASGVGALATPSLFDGELLARLFWVNVWLAGFNMIPAFPMDGGRVLRALLAFGGDYLQATRVAAGIGQGVALLFGLAGLLLPNPFLLFIALFVWIGAAQEGGAAAVRATLGGVPVGRVMVRKLRSVAPTDPLSRVVEAMMDGFQQDFPVVEGGRVVGMLDRIELMRALKQHGDRITVAEVVQPEFPTAHPNEPVEAVMGRLADAGRQSLPVVRHGELVGLLTADNLVEFLSIRNALRDWRATRDGDRVWSPWSRDGQAGRRGTLPADPVGGTR